MRVRPERRLVAFLRNPLLWAAIAGLALPLDASAWSAEIAQWVVYALLPVGFVVVGVQLSSERRTEREDEAREAVEGPWTGAMRRHRIGSRSRRRITARRRRRRIIAPEVAVAVGLRLLVAPALVVGASVLVLDLPEGMLLQAVAPTGLNGLLVAHRFNLTLQPIASSIVWTTSLVTVGVVAVSVVG